MSKSNVRVASHAGSWYSDHGPQLSRELDTWLEKVPSGTKCIGRESAKGPLVQLPSPGARVIIAPHAGYSYSGAAAAWAYKALDLSKAKRVFLLGPSHHHYLNGCALSKCAIYSTPLGDLILDQETIAELHKTGKFEQMSHSVDEAEHSLEMHLPYIYKMVSRQFKDPASYPSLIPILVGSTSASIERAYGQLLAPYLADPTSIFVVSSDFAHWGSRFQYTYYEPSAGNPTSLKATTPAPSSPPIHESIAKVDMRCVGAVESGRHDEFLRVLEETGNTVCGRHPIGVVMAAMETLAVEEEAASAGHRFKFVRYERSSDVSRVKDSSVSYASGFAMI